MHKTSNKMKTGKSKASMGKGGGNAKKKDIGKREC